MMGDSFGFRPDRFDIRMCGIGGRRIEYLCYENVFYCGNPADAVQRMNIYVPLMGLTEEERRKAPIFLQVPTERNRPGRAEEPGRDRRNGINTIFKALMRGYVVVSPGIRGRTQRTGKSPSPVVDLKAAVRFLRLMDEQLPGDKDRIVINGTSTGAGYAAVAGMCGNREVYEPYLEEIGAARERDDVFAISAFCPVYDLEHADMAYEWMFGADSGPVSAEIGRAFPAYLQSLSLADRAGEPLLLERDGSGSFRDYVEKKILEAAQKEYDTHDNQLRRRDIMLPGTEVARQEYVVLYNGAASALDWEGYVRAVGRKGGAPHFDALDLSAPANSSFGTEEIPARHFTGYSYRHSAVRGEMAEGELLRLMNPLTGGGEGCAANWYIRQGSHDSFVSAASPVVLERYLAGMGCSTDLAFSWGLPHVGNYDMGDLFEWIDGITGWEEHHAAGE